MQQYSAVVLGIQIIFFLQTEAFLEVQQVILVMVPLLKVQQGLVEAVKWKIGQREGGEFKGDSIKEVRFVLVSF